MNKKFALLLLPVPVLVLAMAGQWGCSNSQAGSAAKAVPVVEADALASLSSSAAIEVRVSPVQRREWISLVEVSGSLRSRSVVEIRPEIGGRLTAVYFEEGDSVRQGQLLAEIDATNYQLTHDRAAAALAVAEAGLSRAQVAVEHAASEKARADNLLRSGGITQKDHAAAVTGEKDAAAQVALAEAQIAQGKAELAVAEKSLQDCKITAPADGQVQKRNFDRGTLIAAGAPLYTLVDNGQLELECVVPSYRMAAIRPQQRATFQTPTWADRVFNGVVYAINPTVESDSRSVKVILRSVNPGGELRSGMYVRGEIHTEAVANALVIDRDALIPGKNGDPVAVYVVRDGRAQRAKIEIGDTRGELVQVRAGLDEGDLVITEIGPSLKEGMAVKFPITNTTTDN